MCGICGIAGRDTGGPPIGPSALRAMTDAIEHRGPDEDGRWIEPGVALGMRRLSIIDVAGSHQPVRNEDGRVLAVFNGEIFNFAELRRDLAARGHTLASEGDSETIVHLYEEYGLDFVRHLRGMFAIALWDRPNRRLVLARDRMGVKPLYWADTPYGIAFASEVKSLIAAGVVRPELDPMAAELFLAHGFVPGPRSLFAGVQQAPARLACWCGRTAGSPASARTGPPGTWTRSAPATAGRRTPSSCSSSCAPPPTTAWSSDVPLGVMLSGGLDSSLITALMAERLRPAGADVLDRLRRGRRLQRAARRAARRRPPGHRPPRARHLRRRPPGPARRGAVAPGGADRRRLLPRLPAAQPARPRDGHRRALRPGRRRTARRLSQARDRRDGALRAGRGARRRSPASARPGLEPRPRRHRRLDQRPGRPGCWR